MASRNSLQPLFSCSRGRDTTGLLACTRWRLILLLKQGNRFKSWGPSCLRKPTTRMAVTSRNPRQWGADQIHIFGLSHWWTGPEALWSAPGGASIRGEALSNEYVFSHSSLLSASLKKTRAEDKFDCASPGDSE